MYQSSKHVIISTWKIYFRFCSIHHKWNCMVSTHLNWKTDVLLHSNIQRSSLYLYMKYEYRATKYWFGVGIVVGEGEVKWLKNPLSEFVLLHPNNTVNFYFKSISYEFLDWRSVLVIVVLCIFVSYITVFF
jgi:hypothetical protein